VNSPQPVCSGGAYDLATVGLQRHLLGYAAVALPLSASLAAGRYERGVQAIRLTDRWHLLHNLALTLEEFLLQKRSALREAPMPGTEPEV
jgi:hypothetical protein